MSIEVYAFEDKEGNSVSDYTTQDIAEARQFAMGNGCRLIARIFEYSDFELVESYAEGDTFNSDGEYIGEEDVTTKGQYMGEEGTGYSWGSLDQHGDYSNATRGHIQGYTSPCRIRVKIKGAFLTEARNGDTLLFLPFGTSILLEDGYTFEPVWGLTAQEALDKGIAEVIAD
jgi:hypothetical protein